MTAALLTVAALFVGSAVIFGVLCWRAPVIDDRVWDDADWDGWDDELFGGAA